MQGFSIIIPTLNRTEYLKDTLDCLVKQDFEYPYEIIIVDQSTNPDQEIINYVNRFDIIRYFYITTFRGLPEARNYGWQKAIFDYVLYVDDDILCESNLLEEHYKFIINPEIGVVAGGITEKFKKNVDCEVGKFIFYKAEALRGFHQKGTGFVDHAGGGNFSIKQALLAQINGIDENLTKGAALYEETDFCLRAKQAGYKVFYNYEAHVWHLAAPTGGCRVEDIEKYIFNLCRNRSILISRHLKWYHKFTAYSYLLKLIGSYAFVYKKSRILKMGIEGISAGWKIGKIPARYTIIENE